MKYYFYLARCADTTLYSGVTNNLKRRLAEHNSASSRAAKYTRGRQPVKLVYWEKQPDLSAALRREHRVKTWPKAKKEVLSRKKPGRGRSP